MTSCPLRIAVADDEPDMQQYFQKILPRMGHKVVSVATNGRELVDDCRRHHPDLVITDIIMPDMDGIEAAIELYKDQPLPIILVSAYHDQELIKRAEADHVMAYLIKPIKRADLEPAIGIAMSRFEQFEALRREADDLRQALADRKTVERAKEIIMQRAALEEDEAFNRLRQLAGNNKVKLIDIAQTILTAEEAMEP